MNIMGKVAQLAFDDELKKMAADAIQKALPTPARLPMKAINNATGSQTTVSTMNQSGPVPNEFMQQAQQGFKPSGNPSIDQRRLDMRARGMWAQKQGRSFVVR